MRPEHSESGAEGSLCQWNLGTLEPSERGECQQRFVAEVDYSQYKPHARLREHTKRLGKRRATKRRKRSRAC